MRKNEDLISLAEYAKIHGVDPGTCRQRAIRGSYQTARKIGRIWVIDRNEPHIDNRIKDGDYIGWRDKYGKQSKKD